MPDVASMKSRGAKAARRVVRPVVRPLDRRADRIVARAVRREVEPLVRAGRERADRLRELEQLLADSEARADDLGDRLAAAESRRAYDVGLNQMSFDERRAYASYPESAMFINIGAGAFDHPRWTNLDLSSEVYATRQTAAFIEYDLTASQPLPLPSSSVELAYTSHTIEHVKDPDVQQLFAEVFRVLRPGGVFRITCPDAHMYYLAARNNVYDRFFYRMNTWFRRHGIDDSSVSPIDFVASGVATGLTGTRLIRDADPDLARELSDLFHTLPETEFLENLCARVEFSAAQPARHVNWWTHDKVMRTLASSGFTDVRVSTFGGSMAAPMCDTSRFDNTVRDESIYVEATKSPSDEPS